MAAGHVVLAALAALLLFSVSFSRSNFWQVFCDLSLSSDTGYVFNRKLLCCNATAGTIRSGRRIQRSLSGCHVNGILPPPKLAEGTVRSGGRIQRSLSSNIGHLCTCRRAQQVAIDSLAPGHWPRFKSAVYTLTHIMGRLFTYDVTSHNTIYQHMKLLAVPDFRLKFSRNCSTYHLEHITDRT